jgi:hypothetical protein
MTIEIHSPELETLILERMKGGSFRDVEDISMQALTSTAPANERPVSSTNEEPSPKPFWRAFTERVHGVPSGVFERLPTDGASEHDHYLYGSPKRNP